MQQFDLWLKEAISGALPEPNAMTLATVSSDLRPSTRVVLIKGYDERGIVWFTNYSSRKGQQLAGNPFAALQFHWVELERVVRMEGRVEKIAAADSDAYFYSRPRISQAGAVVSNQSEVISGREDLDAQMAALMADEGIEITRPEHWGGYEIVVDGMEFWQGRPGRVHDRARYQKVDGAWVKTRLSP